MRVPTFGPWQKLALACGNAHRTSTLLPTRRSAIPPLPPTLRESVQVSWYGEESEARVVLTRSLTLPLSATNARPGTFAIPEPLLAATSLTVPSEISLWSEFWVWNVSVADARAE